MFEHGYGGCEDRGLDGAFVNATDACEGREDTPHGRATTVFDSATLALFMFCDESLMKNTRDWWGRFMA